MRCYLASVKNPEIHSTLMHAVHQKCEECFAKSVCEIHQQMKGG